MFMLIFFYISIRFFTSMLFLNTTLVIFFGLNSSFGIQNCCTGTVLEYKIVALDLSALDLINLF